MNIELRTDKNIQNSDRLITYVREELNQEFLRHSEKITHFSVHLSDENGPKGGEADIKCMIEARPAGLKPVVVNHKGRTYEQMFPLLGIAFVYLVLVIIFSSLVGLLERRLRQSDRR